MCLKEAGMGALADFIRNLFHLLVKQWLTGTIPATSPYPRTYRHLVVCLKEAGMGALADHFYMKFYLSWGRSEHLMMRL